MSEASDPRLPPDLAESERFKPAKKRRDFLGLAALWSFIVTGLTMCIGMLRLPMPSVFPERGSRFRLGPPDGFPIGSETVVTDRNILVLRDEEGVRVLSLVCPHLGCISSRQDDGSFVCPCHGSKFDAEGRLVEGPAPSGLRYFGVSLAPTGDLMVDQNRVVGPETRLRIGESNA